jgi:hypothetical protein
VNVRRSIAAAAVVLAVPALSSCGMGFNAQTDQPYNVAVGVDERSSSVDVLNALVVSGSKGSGAVVATLVNNDTENDDALRDVSGAGPDADLTVRVAGKTTIPADGLLNLAQDGRIFVRGRQIAPGTFVKLTFSFDRAEAVTLDVPVVSASNPDYADVQVPAAS